jgi:hypothetical protein
MADAVASQTLFDGERIAIMKFTCISDGTGETNVVKVNPSTLNASGGGGACSGVSILKVTGLTHGLEVQLNWKASTPVVIETIPQNTQYQQDFTAIGGLTNNSGAGKDGAITFTTLDASSGDRYSVVLEMQKSYTQPTNYVLPAP